MRPSLPGLLRIAGFALLVLVADATGSTALGLLAALPLLVLGELLQARRRLREEGVLEDEMEALIIAQSSRAALTAFTIIAGLVVVASLVLREQGILALSSYHEGVIDGVALSILVIIMVASLASIYYRRVGVGWGASR